MLVATVRPCSWCGMRRGKPHHANCPRPDEYGLVATSDTPTAPSSTSPDQPDPVPDAVAYDPNFAAASASPATEVPTQTEPDAIAPPSGDTSPEIETSDADGSTTTSSASESESPNWPTSEPPSRPSKRHWRTPTTAMEFASQARSVMTMYLNGEMSREATQTYSAVARTVAQALSTEVTRARAERVIPELTFDDNVFEDDDAAAD